MRLSSAIFAALLFFPVVAGAQQSKKNDWMQGMSGMDNGQMQGMQMGADGLITMHPEIENVDRSNGLILGENPLPPNFHEQPIGRVQAYTFGYDRDVDLIPHVASALGVQITAYGVGNSMNPTYGSRPAGVAVFVRIRPFSGGVDR